MVKITLLCVMLLSVVTDALRAQSVQFTRLTDNITGSSVSLTDRETARYERFLAAVFPTRAMQHYARERDKPITRRVAYTVVEQRGRKFIVAAFTARWNSAINTLAIYRVSGSPIQLWRSGPWEATFFDMHLTTAASGARTLVLFREGGDDASFGISSFFYFVDGRKWLYLRDLTPQDAPVRVMTRFPLRPLMAQDVRLFEGDGTKRSILLSASDDRYYVAGTTAVRPQSTWRYDHARNRLERLEPEDENGLTIGMRERD